jgi:acyl transferase domain-containing protein
MTTSATTNLESIAVVGLSGHYPGAKNVDDFWKNLEAGKESISFFSDEELLKAGVDPAFLSNPNYVKAKGVYEGSYSFDASFFGYNPREAELIDPQQRVFLECAWEALEHAGYDPGSYSGRIGLFGGTGPTKQLFEFLKGTFVKRSFGHLATITSNDKDYLATRIGYKLNLRGPCITLQTACSTSLVAIVVASQNLLNYQCDMALAGGVTLSLEEREGYFYDEGGIVSPDGHCRTFDAAGQGTLFSCGAGLVALKRLDDALADHDTIHAVVRGFGLNNDGSARIGFTAPGMEGQVGVSSDAIAMADINPESIGFVECHGTATPMGDPIEVTALTKSFRSYTQKKNFCALGSVKTNIGHTDAAAGVAGFTKAVLSLKNKIIPASLHFEKPNPQINLEDSPFYVNNRAIEFKRGDEPRRAGVNSFGVGGTNAHVILEEAPETELSSASRPFQLLVWSAKSAVALEQMTARLASHLEDHPGENLADVAFTLQTGRRTFPHRQVLVCRDHEDAIRALKTNAPGRLLTATQEKLRRPLCFLFPGQGAQYAGMGKDLYATELVFRANVDQCADILKPHLGRDIRELLFPSEEQFAKASEELDQTAFTQPAMFVIEYSLAKLLMSWGLKPDAMLGHSIGEYVAACLADVFSLEDALTLVGARGQLMQELPKGSMLGVLLPQDEVSNLLEEVSRLLADVSKLMPVNGGISLAAINSPTTCVVSGPTPAIGQLEKVLETKGVPFRALRTSHAFHSAMMDPILDRFRALLRKVELRAPKIPYVSNLTGTWISASESMSPEYWVSHLRSAVRFSDGAGELLKTMGNMLIEVGPGRTLNTLVSQHPARTPDRIIVSTMPHPKNDSQAEMEFLLTAVGRLWLEGAQVNWKEFYQTEQRLHIPLPTYPFQREHYRLVLPLIGPSAMDVDLSRKKTDVTDWFYYPSWKRVPLPQAAAVLQDTCWILFLDSCGLGLEVAESLRSQGQQVFTVTAGDKFEQIDPSSFTLVPGNRDHYAGLMKQLHATGKTPGDVVHLWGVTGPQEQSELDSCDATLEKQFYGLMFLAQALAGQYSTTPLRIHVVSNDVHDVTGSPVAAPSKATLLGPCKTIPREYRNMKTRNIDVHLSVNGSGRTSQVSALLAELTAQVDDEVVAHRGGHRWLQGFDPYPIQAPLEINQGLRENGVYLITGGMGGIGLVLAEHMGRTVHAKLALVGRSSFPEKTQWQQWTSTHSGEDAVSRKIGQLQRLEAEGAEVAVFRGDVADLNSMRQIVSQVTERWGKIHGVIHAAGIAGDGIIELKTRDIADRVLAPKVKGTLVLEEVLKGTRLDFLILCSSLTSILGDVGQIDYTAANAFLDAYAYSRKGQPGTATIAVNWDRWDEVGMAVNTTTGGSHHIVDRNRNNESIDHPIFTARFNDEGSETYITHLNAADHWIVGEHRLKGSPTLVGTAYLELARAAFAVRSEGAVEMKDVVFMFPLMMGETGGREIQVALRPAKSGFDFLVRSTGDDGQTWEDHAMGNIGAAVGQPKPRQDIAGLIARCGLPHASGPGATFLSGESAFLQLGKRWHNLTSIRAGNDEAIATLDLPSEFAADLKNFILHPALMDSATAFAAQFASQGGHHLPFSYKKIRVNKALPSKLYSHARFQPIKPTDEFMSFDLLLVDEQGDPVVEISGYDMKRVPDDLFKTATDTRAADAESVESAMAARNGPGVKRDKMGDRILSQEGVEVFRRILATAGMPQIVIASKDLSFFISEAQPGRAQAAAEKSLSTPLLAGGHSRPNLATPYVAPGNELEQSVAIIWQSILGIDKVGINDSFVELGGHSLMAIQLAARIREMFEIELSVTSLYKTPTVAGVTAAMIATITEQAGSELVEEALAELEPSTLPPTQVTKAA